MSKNTNENFETTQDEDREQDYNSNSERCNLIVNYLPPELEDAYLKTMFQEHGEVLTAKVVKDKTTKKSLGFGFVKFYKPEHANDAVEKKNGIIIGDKKIKVSFARPSTEEIKNCKLYVTNLPKDYSEQSVLTLFSQYGNIIECRVLQDRSTKSNRGVAFIQFSSRHEANNALLLNGYQVNELEKGLVVKYAEDQQKKKEKKLGGINGLETNLQHLSLKGAYEQDSSYYYGSQRSSHASAGGFPIQTQSNSPSFFYSNGEMLGRRNNMEKGFHEHDSRLPSAHGTGGPGRGGPVDQWYPPSASSTPSHQSFDRGNGYGHSAPNGPTGFMSSGSIEQSFQQPRGNLGQNQLGGKLPAGTPNRTSGVTLLISNLPLHADVTTLHELISPYGRILSAQVEISDSSNGARMTLCSGRGFVQMANISQAQYAIQALHGTIMFEGGSPLQVLCYQYYYNRDILFTYSLISLFQIGMMQSGQDARPKLSQQPFSYPNTGGDLFYNS